MTEIKTIKLWFQFSTSVLKFAGWLVLLYFLLLGSSGLFVAKSLEHAFANSIQTIFFQFFPFYGFLTGGCLFYTAILVQLSVCRGYVEKVISFSLFDHNSCEPKKHQFSKSLRLI